MLQKKDYMMNMIGSFPQQNLCFQLLLYHDEFSEKELIYNDARKVIEIIIDQACALASIHTS